jgi:hypothetical protein
LVVTWLTVKYMVIYRIAVVGRVAIIKWAEQETYRARE